MRHTKNTTTVDVPDDFKQQTFKINGKTHTFIANDDHEVEIPHENLKLFLSMVKGSSVASGKPTSESTGESTHATSDDIEGVRG